MREIAVENLLQFPSHIKTKTNPIRISQKTLTSHTKLILPSRIHALHKITTNTHTIHPETRDYPTGVHTPIFKVLAKNIAPSLRTRGRYSFFFLFLFDSNVWGGRRDVPRKRYWGGKLLLTYPHRLYYEVMGVCGWNLAELSPGLASLREWVVVRKWCSAGYLVIVGNGSKIFKI